MPKEKFNTLDVEDIVDFLINFDEDKDWEEPDVMREEICFEKYFTDIEHVSEIVLKLLNNIDLGISPLTNRALIGLSKRERNQNHKIWLAKQDFTSSFINCILQWMEVNQENQEFFRTITNAKNNEPEFEIRIKKL